MARDAPRRWLGFQSNLTTELKNRLPGATPGFIRPNGFKPGTLPEAGHWMGWNGLYYQAE
jgi:hypothetical protein